MRPKDLDLVFDASVWVDALNGGANADHVQSIQIMNTVGTPQVVVAQLAEFYGRRMPERWDVVNEAVRDTSVLLPLTPEIAVAAGRTKAARTDRRDTLTLLDCIILETARLHDAELVTKDPVFRGLEHVQYLGPRNASVADDDPGAAAPRPEAARHRETKAPKTADAAPSVKDRLKRFADKGRESLARR